MCMYVCILHIIQDVVSARWDIREERNECLAQGDFTATSYIH